MSQEILDEIAWNLDKIVADRIRVDRYCNEELMRKQLAEEFAKWLVENFREECGHNE